MISPHFPPDSSAGTHRVRLLAPHLPEYGWEPTVLTVAAEDYEGRLDHALAELVPPTLRVVRDKSGAPTRCSSARMVWLTADGVTPNCRAAARNPRSSATATNTTSPSR